MEKEQDLDELLEEVESKFLRPAADAPVKRGLGKVPSFGDDGLPPLDEILRDMGDASGGEGDPSPAAPAHPRKCVPAYVSGADVACGLTTLTRARACSNLFCVDCDFNVQVFEGLKWRKDTDYLFLRTNMPHSYRLQERLRTAAGWRAYACQCSHFSTRHLEQLQRIPQLKWICRGH